MALTSEEQELVSAVNAAMPGWFKSDTRAQEDLGMMAKIFGPVRALGDHWLKTQSMITLAAGATLTEPDWLAQHARDRGTWRQGGEITDTLRYRLRALPSATTAASVTRTAILAMIAELLASELIAGVAALYEAPRDSAYMIDVVGQATGTGGTFSGPDGSGRMIFLPTTPFPFPPIAQGGRVKSVKLVFASATSAANNGTFDVIDLVGNGARFTNGSGVAGADASVTWAVRRMATATQQIDGFPYSYVYDHNDAVAVNVAAADRLATGGLASIIAILPVGTPAPLADAIAEQIRRIRAAGVVSTVERRQV